MEPFAALMMLGIRVREVVDLAEDAVFCRSHELLLIDSRLSRAARDAVSDRILPLLACPVAGAAP